MRRVDYGDSASSLFGALVIGALLIAAGYGWINNIILLAHMGLSPLTTMVVLRAIGIFVAPLGIVLGFVR